MLFCAESDPNSALPLLERALEIRTSQLEPDHVELAESLFNLAGLLAEEVPQRSRELAERALSIRERAFGTDDPETERVRLFLRALP